MLKLTERVVGGFLLLVGLGFFALLAFVLISGDLRLSDKGGPKLAFFFVGTGAVLMWVGSRFLERDADEEK